MRKKDQYFLFLILVLFGCSSKKVIQTPITFDEERKLLSLEYLENRYGIVQDQPTIVPQMVVVHWTAIPTFERSYKTFYGPKLPGWRPAIAGAGALNVSTQYLIDRNGDIHQLLPDTTFGRHVIGLNHCAIGIENVGDGKDYPLTKKQFKANVALIRQLAENHSIKYLIGHHEYQEFIGHPLWLELDPDYLTTKSDPGDEFMGQLREKLSDLGLQGPPKGIKISRQPAEYDKQDAVWLIWPPGNHLEGYSNEQVMLEIIRAILPATKIKLAVASEELRKKAMSYIPKSMLKSSHLEIILVPSIEFWARDMGPVFVKTIDGKKAIADFNFNAWGYSDTTEAETQIEEKFDELVAKHMDLPVISTAMISEGGDREVNGEGTLMVVEAVEQGRNPGMTKAEMEQEFKRLLGATKVIWLKKGVYEDDHTFLGPIKTTDGTKAYTVVTTNGHIDEFARFANDTTILLAKVDPADLDDPVAQENHQRMEENYEILKKASDQHGKPFRIVRVPMPKTILGTMKPGDMIYDYISTLNYKDGSTFPKGEPIRVIAAASYLNFLITNGVIIAQKYWREGLDESIKARDEEVKKTLAGVFPDRKIVMLDALAVNFGGGGIHCITMQEPKIGK